MGAFNWRGYSNATLDKLLQDAAIEVDEAKRRKLLEHLPPAYEAYVMREQVGIAHPQVHDKRTSRIHEALKKQVLDGRKLLGEPENFDF